MLRCSIFQRRANSDREYRNRSVCTVYFCNNLHGNRAVSFDHFVRNREQCRRHGEVERLGSFEVDDYLELHCCLDREIGGILAFENPINIRSRTAK